MSAWLALAEQIWAWLRPRLRELIREVLKEEQGLVTTAELCARIKIPEATWRKTLERDPRLDKYRTTWEIHGREEDRWDLGGVLDHRQREAQRERRRRKSDDG